MKITCCGGSLQVFRCMLVSAPKVLQKWNDVSWLYKYVYVCVYIWMYMYIMYIHNIDKREKKKN